MSPVERFETVIVGTGFAGLGMGVMLRKTGREDFLILEQADDVAGTWRDNTYPGCACDVQSHLYSFSFETNPNWTRRFAGWREIRDYLRHCADKFGLRPKIRFGCRMTGARWDEAAGEWEIEIDGAPTVRARFLVAGVGGLSEPQLPDVPGLESFAGEVFHSARWRHDLDLRGKRIAVVGTGASAIQFVPRIAPEAAALTVFQRTPPWIMHKPDGPFGRLARALLRLPALRRLYRWKIYWQLESRVIGFAYAPWIMRVVERIAKAHIRRQIADPALRRLVTPDFRIGCKRILMADDWYPTLQLPHVRLVARAVAVIHPDAVEDADGNRHEADILVLGTGFDPVGAMTSLSIRGRDDQDLNDVWASGAEAHLGTTVHGFPNLFLVVGPNTGLGHNSLVFMIESQIRYIISTMSTLDRLGKRSAEVRPEVQSAWNARLQDKLSKSIWQSGCRSWYLDAEGRNRTLWPGFTFAFRWATRRFDPRLHTLR